MTGLHEPGRTTSDEIVVEITLPDEPRSAARARRCVDSLEGHCHPETTAKARLLITELVAAAVAGHGPTEIRARITLSDGIVRTEVTTERLSAKRPRGLALLLVRRIAVRWGVNGGTVWFELEDRPPTIRR
jgi:hypothetical protein